MSEDTIEVFCNGDTFAFDEPTVWPECSASAVCSPPHIMTSIMESDHKPGEMIMEGDGIR